MNDNFTTQMMLVVIMVSICNWRAERGNTTTFSLFLRQTVSEIETGSVICVVCWLLLMLLLGLAELINEWVVDHNYRKSKREIDTHNSAVAIRKYKETCTSSGTLTHTKKVGVDWIVELIGLLSKQ